jgi:hypothetical protein
VRDVRDDKGHIIAARQSAGPAAETDAGEAAANRCQKLRAPMRQYGVEEIQVSVWTRAG